MSPMDTQPKKAPRLDQSELRPATPTRIRALGQIVTHKKINPRSCR
jgi:hypothetical protein